MRVIVTAILVSMTLLASAWMPISAQASGPADASIGRVKMVKGEVTIQRGETSIPATPGVTVARSDTLVTGADGQIGITFVDNSRFALGPNTTIDLEQFSFDSTTHEGRFVSRVQRGRLSVISGRIAKASPEAMEVRTPTQILGVRGTEFLIRVEQ